MNWLNPWEPGTDFKCCYFLGAPFKLALLEVLCLLCYDQEQLNQYRLSSLIMNINTSKPKTCLLLMKSNNFLRLRSGSVLYGGDITFKS